MFILYICVQERELKPVYRSWNNCQEKEDCYNERRRIGGINKCEKRLREKEKNVRIFSGFIKPKILVEAPTTC